MIWHLPIEGEITPSANEYLAMQKRAYWKIRELRDKWGWLLIGAGLLRIPKAEKKRHVIVIRYSKGDLDWCNAVTPIDKFILDFLVKKGILIDDNNEFMELEVKTFKGTRVATVIEISDILTP